MKQQAEALAPRAIYKVAVSRVRAAELLDVSTGTFDDWVRRGLMPKGVKIGALRRWDAEDNAKHLRSDLFKTFTDMITLNVAQSYPWRRSRLVPLSAFRTATVFERIGVDG